MSGKSDHKVCAWLDEFDEHLELEDSDDSDACNNKEWCNNKEESELDMNNSYSEWNWLPKSFIT